MNAAIVIGVDEYGRGAQQLEAAVSDAEAFFAWVLNPTGGNVRREHARLLLSRRPGQPRPRESSRRANASATKDNIVTAINDLVAMTEQTADASWERLYFYFAGHGMTAWIANREESALVTPGFDSLHPDHSLAVRSLTEFFETTAFRDQFFFLDACREVAFPGQHPEIGRWPIPRRRIPGAPPAQQFILYAVPSGITTPETRAWWPGEAKGKFSDVVEDALDGKGRAKAWSWERSRYEVRWERLVEYVTERIKARSDVGEGRTIEVPQEAGSRGVADRDRDALVVGFPRNRQFKSVRLTVRLDGKPPPKATDITVLDAVGRPVASALAVPGESHDFELPPKTYAVRAASRDKREGVLEWPVDLYAPDVARIDLREPGSDGDRAVERLTGGDEGLDGEAVGVIVVEPPDPLTVTELRDEAGTTPESLGPPAKRGEARFRVPAGFYRVRLIGPEPEAASEEQPVVLRADEIERVTVPAERLPEPPARVVDLAARAGGEYRPGDRSVLLRRGAEPIQWAQPSTILTVAIGEGLRRSSGGLLDRLGVDAPELEPESAAGIALYAVAGTDEANVAELRVAVTPLGEAVDREAKALAPSDAGVAGFVWSVKKARAHWLTIERDDDATVVALPVLPRRLATVVLQVESNRLRMYQAHPSLDGGPSATPRRLRRVEHLERLILGGRLDGARQLAEELARGAEHDPFAGCVAGYALVRFGSYNRRLLALLGKTIDDVIRVAPKLSDAYVLRAHHQASEGNDDGAAQAFADAVNVGVPAFGEGLTRLIEGLRATNFVHPRGALVRHIFQQHARGLMWSAFTPVRTPEKGRLVVSGADLGFEG